MKQIMIDMMNAMMPYMKWPLWVAIFLVAVGLVLVVLRFMGREGQGLVGVSSVLIGIGVFYIACHLLGLYLGMTPKLNFGDAKKFEFILVPFWFLGAGALTAGVLMRFVARR